MNVLHSLNVIERSVRGGDSLRTRDVPSCAIEEEGGATKERNWR